MHQHASFLKWVSRRRIRPKACFVQDIPRQVRPSAGPIPSGIIQSCSSFTVGAWQEPIRLAVEKETGEGLAASHRACFFPFMFLLLLCSSSYTAPHMHTQRHTHIHTCRGQERGLPRETEAWVKEGCWQQKGLTHLLAPDTLSPPSNTLKGTVQQCRAKHSGWSLDPCTCLHWVKRVRPCICANVGVKSGRELKPWDPLPWKQRWVEGKKKRGRKPSVLKFPSLYIRAPVITSNLYANRVIITVN